MDPEIQEYIYSAKSVSSIVSARGLAATGRLLKTVKEQDLLDSLHEFLEREDAFFHYPWLGFSWYA